MKELIEIDEILGKYFANEPIAENERMALFAFDKRQMKNQKYLYLFNITDQTDSISCKLFLKEDNLQLSDGDFVKIICN